MTRREIIKQGGMAYLAMTFPLSSNSFSKYNSMTDKNNFDAIIIGGSYAGLSAAMSLGRSLRNVLIIDGGMPCNKQTPYSHNFITQDGIEPGEISKKAKTQVLKYDTVKFLEGLAISGEKTKEGFEITTQTNEVFKANKLVFATGIKDIMPNIKGFSECWGISIVHCPYCHGYEIRNQKTAIFANGEKAFHLAPLVKNLTADLSILTSGKASFSSEQMQKLNQHNIKIIEKEITEIEHEKGQLKSINFKDGSREDFSAAYGVLSFNQHSDIPASLGCELTEEGYIKVNQFQNTSLAGVYACGDNSTMIRSISNAVYQGNLAGAIANMELTNEAF